MSIRLFSLFVSCIHIFTIRTSGVVASQVYRKFHSGVYTNAEEEYAGAFFISKSRFLGSTQGIERAKFPEGVLFNTIKLRDSCEFCENFLTRDYFDFTVEHLSSTSNVLNVIPLSNDQKREIFQLLNDRLEKQVKMLKKSSSNKGPTSGSTIAIVAFSDSEANFDTTAQEPLHLAALRDIRHNYFKATIYGMHRYFSNIIVYASTPEDKQKVLSWSLPLLDVVDLSMTLKKVPKSQYYNRRPVEQLLPKYALLDLTRRLKSAHLQPSWGKRSPSSVFNWSAVTSVFYTEGDQIVHLKKLKYLYQMFDASGGDFLFIPHRLQTLPLYENFPPSIQRAWKYRRVTRPVRLVSQAPTGGGSCCDNGRLNLPGCGNWWYFCDKWGVKNYTTWFKFGENGFTSALATEHQGVCSYSQRHITCPVPPGCTLPAGLPHARETESDKVAWKRQFLRKMRACGENNYNATIVSDPAFLHS